MAFEPNSTHADLKAQQGCGRGAPFCSICRGSQKQVLEQNRLSEGTTVDRSIGFILGIGFGQGLQSLCQSSRILPFP